MFRVMPNNVFRPFGMTACRVRVMPNNVFRPSGMTACLAKVMPNNTFFSCGMTNLPFPNSLINHYGQKEKKHQKNTVKIGKKWKVMLKINNFYGQKDKNNTKIP